MVCAGELFDCWRHWLSLYDTATTGTDTTFDQILQIAEKLRAWSPAIFTGYNTLSFDEPLLRQAFYQTLQPVYLTNTNGNQRADVLRLALATAALAPNAMAVPISAKGRPTLRLDTLVPANGFAHEHAHDAVADVEATNYMARLIRDRAPAVWASLMPLVDKSEVQARVLSGQALCLVQYHMGRPTVLPVVGCGQSHDHATMLGVAGRTKGACKPSTPSHGLSVQRLLKL